jgi:hypothetical protein
MDFRGIIRGKTRIALAWAFSAAIILSAKEYPIWPGIAICFLGASLRYWASGFLRKDSTVAAGGPYGMTRNPLYVGTYIMAAGTAAAIQNWWLVLALTVLYYVIYHYIILDEEVKLKKMFGNPYNEYCKVVPRFIPRLWPISQKKLSKVNSRATHFSFSHSLANKNKAYEAYAAFAALIGLCYLIVWAKISLL